MWVRSFALCDWVAVERAQRYSVGSSHGEIVATSSAAERRTPRATPRESSWEFGVFSDPRGIPLLPPSHLGFGLSSIRQTFDKAVSLRIRSLSTRLVMVPYWALALLLGILPALAIWPDLRRRRRSLAGRCPSCGYDLRDTADGCRGCAGPPGGT